MDEAPAIRLFSACDELTAGCDGCVHERRRQTIRCSRLTRSRLFSSFDLQFSPHRPSTANGETGFDYCRRGMCPSQCWLLPSAPSALGLLKRVVDRDRESWVRVLLSESAHRLGHAVEEELLSTSPYRRDDRMLRRTLRSLERRGYRTVRENCLERTAAKRRKSPKGPRSRYCRSTADQWRRLCPCCQPV